MQDEFDRELQLLRERRVALQRTQALATERQQTDALARRVASQAPLATALIDDKWFDLGYIWLMRGAIVALLLVTVIGSVLGVNLGTVQQMSVAYHTGQAWSGLVWSLLFTWQTTLAILAQIVCTVVQFAHRHKRRHPLYVVTMLISSGTTFLGWGTLLFGATPTLTPMNIVLGIALGGACIAADAIPERYMIRG